LGVDSESSLLIRRAASAHLYDDTFIVATGERPLALPLMPALPLPDVPAVPLAPAPDVPALAVPLAPLPDVLAPPVADVVEPPDVDAPLSVLDVLPEPLTPAEALVPP
jgi:hypothetical protein